MELAGQFLDRRSRNKRTVAGLAFRISDMDQYQRVSLGFLARESFKKKKSMGASLLLLHFVCSMVVAFHPGTTDIWAGIASEKVIDKTQEARKKKEWIMMLRFHVSIPHYISSEL